MITTLKFCVVAIAILLPIAGIGMIFGQPQRAEAADVENRDFTVFVDGKKAGEYHMNIQSQDNGTVAMSAKADVRVSYLVYNYTYSYQGSEVWQGGRLLSLASTANDDGKRFAVQRQAEGNSLRVKVNGQEHRSPFDVWTTSYWTLPDARRRNGAMPLLDNDTGRDINSNLQYVGLDQVKVAGQIQKCAHYRLTGGVSVELWYDGQDRLVREDTVDEGHRTVLELIGIHR